MIFSLFVNRPSGKPSGRSSALLTAKALIASGHEVYRVFFYAEGVRHCIEGFANSDDSWSSLLADTETDLCFCSASVKKYQVSLPEHINVSLGGLVQLLDAQLNSDRVVSLS